MKIQYAAFSHKEYRKEFDSIGFPMAMGLSISIAGLYISFFFPILNTLPLVIFWICYMYLIFDYVSERLDIIFWKHFKIKEVKR